ISNRFKIKMGKTDEIQALAALAHAFEDVVESRGALQFGKSDQDDWRNAPVYKIVSHALGENINRPDLREDVRPFVGGVAIMLDHITPPQTREALETRLDLARQGSQYSATLSRTHKLMVIEGSDAQV